ncbi:hypothetical protein EVAR_84338_1 [Eumeta japonica]|uniref:Uncharacterized protein n=1 Tax=Eumeta variegata TaxID=151549 RepID=A0A4C1U496_EUMVA|nr:hypothetical protein EVAR_84338_1 [Eumeta japonica]
MTARARVWVGDWAPARCQSMDPPDTDHCHFSRRGRVLDEKTPGHEATISPPSRTCTLKIEGVKDPRAEPMHAVSPPSNGSGASDKVALQPSYCEARQNKEVKSESENAVHHLIAATPQEIR